eukprot:Sspe_Gene.104421::Locus_80628_Transcript_1_1_Confidence_1.000_Length_843::g.104421::m.104421
MGDEVHDEGHDSDTVDDGDVESERRIDAPAPKRIMDIVQTERRIFFTCSKPVANPGKTKMAHGLIGIDPSQADTKATPPELLQMKLKTPPSEKGYDIAAYHRLYLRDPTASNINRAPYHSQRVNGHSEKLPRAVLLKVLDFLPAAALRRALATNQLWNCTIRDDISLGTRVHDFEYTADYDGEGILYYLGTGLGRRRGRDGRLVWVNPTKALLPVTVYTSAVRNKRGVEEVVNNGVSHYSTDAIPHSWVAVDFGAFRVRPTYYTIG